MATFSRLMDKKAAHRERRVAVAVQALTVGAFGTCAGIALSITGLENTGGVMTLSGLLLLVWGLHRFGRLGADPADVR